MAGPRSSRRVARAALALIPLLVLIVVAERARWFPRLLAAADAERVWIWTSDPPRRVEPRAFLAARDFELDAPPLYAELEIYGDPEYIVHLNGLRMGSGRVAAGATIDRYPVAPRLRAGTNRIVLELRSATGSGGATVRLVDGNGRVLVASDSEWVVYGSSWPGLFVGDSFYPTGRVEVLGRSPFARWSGIALGPLRPLFPEASAGELVPAVAYRKPPGDAWVALSPDPPRSNRLGNRIEVDFGREVTGYLQVGFNRREMASGLLRFGAGSEADAGWDPDVVLLAPGGRGSWQDATPRRFRYVGLVGLAEASRFALLPVSEATFALLGPSHEAAGLLGARTHPVRLPVVDEIWREVGIAFGAPADGAEVKPAGGARKPVRAPARGARRRPGGS